MKIDWKNDKHELVDAIRKSRVEWQLEGSFIKSFFNVNDFKEIKEYSERLPEFIFRVVSYNLNEFLKLNNYEILDLKNLDVESNNPVQYARIEIDKDKTAYILKKADIFIKNEKEKFIIHFERDYALHTNFSIRISSLSDSGKMLLDDMLKYAEENNFYKHKKIDTRFNFIAFDDAYSWEDIVLNEDIKTRLQQNISNFLDSVDIYKKNKVQMKRGIILKGKPGTGKTLIGKVLCCQSDWSFIWVPPQSLKVAGINQICEAARRLSPAILFLEDLDLYTEERESNQDKVMLGELMNQLDGLQENNQVLVIATTNKAEYLEQAVLNRPGRFDVVIELPLPDQPQVFEMLKIFTKNIKLSDDVDFNVIVKYIMEKNEKYTGAHIKEVVNLAILHAIDDKSITHDKTIILKQKHLLDSINLATNKQVQVVRGFSSPVFEDESLEDM